MNQKVWRVPFVLMLIGGMVFFQLSFGFEKESIENPGDQIGRAHV